MQSAGKCHALFKKVLGALSHHRETWHADTVSGGQYRKTLVFSIDENPCELGRRKVQVSRPLLKSPSSLNRKSANLAY